MSVQSENYFDSSYQPGPGQTRSAAAGTAEAAEEEADLQASFDL